MRVPAIVVLLVYLTATPAAADGKALEQGLRALAHEDAHERSGGLRWLAKCRAQPERARAVRALQRALFDAHPAIRAGAIQVLASFDARAAGGDLVRLLELERDVQVLPTALLALGTLRVAGADAVVRRFASHPEAGVRAAAMSAAGDLGGPAMRRLVLNALQMAGAEDAEWLVRSAAVVALSKIGRAEDLTLVQRAYRQGGGRTSWLARASIARALAALHPDPRAALERLLADPDPRVAVTAAKGLADAGLERVLLGHLRSGQSGVRAAAVGGVRQADLRAALPQLRRMARFDRARGVRWAAAKVLFLWDDPLGDTLMLDAVQAKEAAIWTEAVALLSRKTGLKRGRDVGAWKSALSKRRRGAPR